VTIATALTDPAQGTLPTPFWCHTLISSTAKWREMEATSEKFAVKL
jgi:hypothetical protein